jgi:hypothetical protein
VRMYSRFTGAWPGGCVCGSLIAAAVPTLGEAFPADDSAYDK